MNPHCIVNILVLILEELIPHIYYEHGQRAMLQFLFSSSIIYKAGRSVVERLPKNGLPWSGKYLKPVQWMLSKADSCNVTHPSFFKFDHVAPTKLIFIWDSSFIPVLHDKVQVLEVCFFSPPIINVPLSVVSLGITYRGKGNMYLNIPVTSALQELCLNHHIYMGNDLLTFSPTFPSVTKLQKLEISLHIDPEGHKEHSAPGLLVELFDDLPSTLETMIIRMDVGLHFRKVLHNVRPLLKSDWWKAHPNLQITLALLDCTETYSARKILQDNTIDSTLLQYLAYNHSENIVWFDS